MVYNITFDNKSTTESGSITIHKGLAKEAISVADKDLWTDKAALGPFASDINTALSGSKDRTDKAFVGFIPVVQHYRDEKYCAFISVATNSKGNTKLHVERFADDLSQEERIAYLEDKYENFNTGTPVKDQVSSSRPGSLKLEGAGVKPGQDPLSSRGRAPSADSQGSTESTDDPNKPLISENTGLRQRNVAATNMAEPVDENFDTRVSGEKLFVYFKNENLSMSDIDNAGSAVEALDTFKASLRGKKRSTTTDITGYIKIQNGQDTIGFLTVRLNDSGFSGEETTVSVTLRNGQEPDALNLSKKNSHIGVAKVNHYGLNVNIEDRIGDDMRAQQQQVPTTPPHVWGKAGSSSATATQPPNFMAKHPIATHSALAFLGAAATITLALATLATLSLALDSTGKGVGSFLKENANGFDKLFGTSWSEMTVGWNWPWNDGARNVEKPLGAAVGAAVGVFATYKAGQATVTVSEVESVSLTPSNKHTRI